jgi:hypothetical protein
VPAFVGEGVHDLSSSDDQRVIVAAGKSLEKLREFMVFSWDATNSIGFALRKGGFDEGDCRARVPVQERALATEGPGRKVEAAGCNGSWPESRQKLFKFRINGESRGH